MKTIHIENKENQGAVGDYALWWRVFGKPYTWMTAFQYNGFHFNHKPAVTNDFGDIVEVAA